VTGVQTCALPIYIKGYLCFSHFHWDHIQGLPFFEPAYIAGNDFTLVGPAQPTADLLQILSGQMASVYFPVGLEQFGAALSFQEIGEGTVTLGGVQFDTLSSLHPGRALIYRLTHGDKRIVYATDNELPRDWKATGGATAHELDRFLRFFQGADLLIHDAEYLPKDYNRTWGHSMFTSAVDLGIRAKARRLGLFHHNQKRTDDQIDATVAEAQKLIARRKSPLDCFAVGPLFEVNLK
jgi:phosphoribosyl 1,2-cyclic phosphodiesterase